MNAPLHEIEAEVLAVVLRCSAEGNKLRLPDEQLDRDLYLRVNKVLAAEGGKWNRKEKAHVFAHPAESILARLRAGSYEDPKKDLGFYETPPALAERVVALARIEDGMTVLEPSAGKGALALPAAKAGGEVTVVEILRECADELRRLRFSPVFECDFLAMEFAEGERFDRVVMNPPFAHNADVEHVTTAYGVLKPGGRLVAIMSAGVEFREDKVHKLFRKLLAETGGIVARLPSGTFKEAGTGVRAIIVQMNRP